jgi:hypothetical protein
VFAGLLVLAWVVATLVVAVERERLDLGRGLREALLAAATGCGVLVVAFTECLSALGWLTFGPLLVCWSAVVLVLSVWVAIRRRCLAGWWPGRPELGPWGWAMLALCVGLLALSGAGAVVSPPNNWDSMLAHMPRQVYWMQQASVAHFPTQYVPQTSWPPFAEFVGLHLMILSGGDAWANLVQWFALALTVIAVSVIARDLGLDPIGQILAAVFAVTLPDAVLQSLNTKGDLVVSLWLCLAAWWALRPWVGRPWNAVHALLFGAAVGLLLLTKATGYVFVLPAIVVAGLGLLVKQCGFTARAAVVGAVLALLLNAGHWTRNYCTYHALLGPPFMPDLDQRTGTLHPAAVVSNVVKNLALHLGTSSERWNSTLNQGIVRLHRGLGIDVDDPRLTLQSIWCGPFRVTCPLWNEDTAPAPVHVGLLLALLAGLPFTYRRIRGTTWLILAIPSLGFVLFCATVKWWPWHARLHVPLLCLFAVVLAAWGRRGLGRMAAPLVVVGLLVAVAPYLTQAQPKALLGRRSVFFADRRDMLFGLRTELAGPTCAAVEQMAAWVPRSVGLYQFLGQWEYPLEHLLLERLRPRPFFVPLFAAQTAEAPHRRAGYGQAPDLIVGPGATRTLLTHAETGARYLAAGQALPFTLYLPLDRALPDAAADGEAAFGAWEALEGWQALKDRAGYHWGLGPASTLRFHGDGRPGELVVEVRRTLWPEQELTIKLNEEVIHRHAFGNSFDIVRLCLPVRPRAGENRLTFEYRFWDREGEAPYALLFRKLQFLPLRGEGHPPN